MTWIQSLLGRFWHFITVTLQASWLILLYIFVAYVMVGSLGSLQLRDALEAEQQGASYDFVIRTKEDFHLKADILSRKSHRSVKEGFKAYDANEDKLFNVWDDVIESAFEAEIIEQPEQYPSNFNYNESFQVIGKYCSLERAQEDVCKYNEERKRLGIESDRLYAEAEEASNKQDTDLIGQDNFIKLREDTPFADLFTTVDFMNSLGYQQFLQQPRELLVLQLTMVMGTLGSLVALTWSFIRRDNTMSLRRMLFLPLVGSVSAFIIFVFFKAGQLTISSGPGTSSLSPFFLSFVGVISGLMSERAYARMESVGTKFFTDEGDQLRWGVRLREALESSDINIAELASYLNVEEGTAKNLVNQTTAATLQQQLLIAACLRRSSRDLFTDEAPKSIAEGFNDKVNVITNVPNLIGVQSKEVEQTLCAQGLKLGDIIEDHNDNAPIGSVTKQQPSAGEQVPTETVVSITISTSSDDQPVN